MVQMATSAKTTASAASSVATEKLARQRLSVRELAQTLGSVSMACRQRGVSRTQFYGTNGAPSSGLSQLR